MKSENGRIEVIDSFRAISIISVVLYHYYSRWTIPHVNYYPLNSLFQNGYYGVNFFFVISGFVIFYTLENTKSYGSFIVKRYIRLFPPILLCTFISCFFVEYFDKSHQFPGFHSYTALDFIPSLTFTPSSLWNYLFNRSDISIFCGAYWTLWVEFCFYYLAGLIYYLNRENFFSNWIKLAVAILLLRIITYSKFYFIYSSNSAIVEAIRSTLLFFNFSLYAVYFMLGIVFYTIFSGKKISVIQMTMVGSMFLIELFMLPNYVEKLLLIVIVCLFFCFIYAPRYLNFLKNPLFLRIGLISYTFYLLHENIGVVVINNLSTLFSSLFILQLIPFIVFLLVIGFSEFIFRFYEKPVNDYLKRKIRKVTLK